MNERIKELIKQASGIEHDDDGDELTPALVGKGVEKFAELIVRECAELTLDYKNDQYYNGWIEYRRLVKEHFGVEE